ncbi:MAG: hypothetical protein ABJD13_11570 [Paracoccaceae bacterium]
MKNGKYDKDDFRILKETLKKTLYDAGEPLSCLWHNATDRFDHLIVEYEDGDKETHVAEACNLAAVVSGLERLLSLPRSHIACSELSEIALLQLDVLREYLRDAVPTGDLPETQNELVVRLWAGFLKHPRQLVSAHRCDWIPENDDTSVLGTDAILAWDTELRTAQNRNAKRDELKRQFANSVATIQLPEVSFLVQFLNDCGTRANRPLA